MTKDDKEFLKEFAGGLAIGIGVAGVFVMCVALTGALIGKPESKLEDRFKVVDTYSNCAIVRYRPENRAQDVFFLDCGNAHLSERE